MSTPDELEMISKIAATTGIILDPVYSGKAVYGMMQKLRENRQAFAGNSVLFVHTGGVFGLYDKIDSFASVTAGTVEPLFASL